MRHGFSNLEFLVSLYSFSLCNFLQKAVQGYVIASLYFKIGEYHTALKYVSKYLCIDPDSFVASKLQGECYEKLNRIDDALASYEKALNSADKKKDVKPSADNHNVDGIRDEMETIEILSPPVVGHEQGGSANIATVNVIAETVGHSRSYTSCEELPNFYGFILLFQDSNTTSYFICTRNGNEYRRCMFRDYVRVPCYPHHFIRLRRLF